MSYVSSLNLLEHLGVMSLEELPECSSMSAKLKEFLNADRKKIKKAMFEILTLLIFLEPDFSLTYKTKISQLLEAELNFLPNTSPLAFGM